MTSPLPLPPFDRDHVDRILAAQAAGDDDRAEQVRRHLVDEGTTDPHETAVMESVTRASLLAKRMLDAREAGDDKEADRLESQLHRDVDADTLRIVLAAMLVSAGRQQGWLPEREYDRLHDLAHVAGPQFAGVIRQIRRGRPAGA